MTHQHDIADTMRAADHASRSYGFGLLISRIFHPVFMNMLMFLIVGYFTGATRLQGIAWAFACVVVLVVPPALFFNWRMRQGAYSDEDVSVRQQRTELYLFGIATVAVGMVVLMLLGLPKPFVALLVSALVLGVLGVAINSFWKISVHGGSVAATATVAALYSPELAILLWLGALAVAWARVRTGNHTPMQVGAGMLLSSIVVLLVFRAVAG